MRFVKLTVKYSTFYLRAESIQVIEPSDEIIDKPSSTTAITTNDGNVVYCDQTPEEVLALIEADVPRPEPTTTRRCDGCGKPFNLGDVLWHGFNADGFFHRDCYPRGEAKAAEQPLPTDGDLVDMTLNILRAAAKRGTDIHVTKTEADHFAKTAMMLFAESKSRFVIGE